MLSTLPLHHGVAVDGPGAESLVELIEALAPNAHADLVRLETRPKVWELAVRTVDAYKTIMSLICEPGSVTASRRVTATWNAEQTEIIARLAP